MVFDTARSRLFRPACEWLGRQLIAERERWILWLPVALGLGIGVYFVLPMEPPRVVGDAGLVLACLLAVLIRKLWHTRLLVLGLVAFALGFVVAQTRTHVVASPLLDRALGFAIVEGEIESVEPGPKGPRVILSVASLNSLPDAERPGRVRLRPRTLDMDIQPGDHVRVRGRLAPPPSASYPGGYDFSRKAWFARLGAVGLRSALWNGSVRPGITVSLPMPDNMLRLCVRVYPDASPHGLMARLAASRPPWQPGCGGIFPRMSVSRCAILGSRICWLFPACIWDWWQGLSSG
jgi:hypothetical protein